MNDEPEADDQLEDEDFIAEDDSTTFRKPNKLVRNIVLSCVGGLVAVLSVWLVIAVPELIKLFEPPPPPPLTLAQQI